MRVLAYALNVPADREKGDLVLAKSLWDVDEPDLWQVDLTGQVIHWIEVGQPDDRRLSQGQQPRREGHGLQLHRQHAHLVGGAWWASSTARPRWRCGPSTPTCLAVARPGWCARTMAWQITVQDGTVWVSDTVDTVEITPKLLKARDGRDQYSN